MLNKGKLFVLSAPAGTGKTTLVKKLTNEFPNIKQSISFTTRAKRTGEIDGVDYHFIKEQTFKEMIVKGDFLEYVTLYNTYYGTSLKWVKDELEKGYHVILVIDTQGGLKLKGKQEAVFIFVKPPSIDDLRLRLSLRNTEMPEIIEERLSHAAREIADGMQYDYTIINDKLEQAYQDLKNIIVKETTC